MNTFVLFLCILISGVGFVFAEKAELKTWYSATMEPTLKNSRDAPKDIKLAATKYFRWYIRARNPEMTPEEREPAPTIPKHTLHAMFARVLRAPENPNKDLDVFAGFNNDPPPYIAKSDHGYLEAYYEERKQIPPKQLDEDISSALKNFINTYTLELKQCGLRTVTIDYDVIRIRGKDTDSILSGIYVIIQIVGTV